MFSLLLVLVPGSVFAVITFVNARHALEDAIGRQLTEVAHDVAHVVVRTLAEERKKTRTWARHDFMREIVVGDVDKRISRFLASVKADDPAYRHLLGVDASGRVVAASDAALIGNYHGEDRWFELAREGKKVLSGPFHSADEGRALMHFAAPIYDPERPNEVIGVLLSLYDWKEGLAQIDGMRETLGGLGLTVDVLILDETGTVIGGSGAKAALDDLMGQNLRAAGWRTVQRRHRKRPGFMVERQREALVGYAQLDRFRPRWSVMVMQPLDEALAPVYRMRRQFLIALVAVLLGALGVASLLATRMIGPLAELTRATRSFGRSGGSLEPVRVRTRDEIGQLARSFNEMGDALGRAQDDLVGAAKFAFVGQVAAEIGHEVRTPLSVLRSSAQILRRSPKHQPELIDMIIGEVDRLDRVVGGLLEIARPRNPLVEPTLLAPLLSRAVDFVARQASQKGIVIDSELAAELPLARCDPEQIYQVALNLIVNALQALPRGGRIIVRALRCGDGRVGFEIVDNGPGIPEDVRERVFLPFFTTREGGTGLGLAVVQRIVQSHRGSVKIDSEPGRGSTFRVELPVAEPEP